MSWKDLLPTPPWEGPPIPRGFIHKKENPIIEKPSERELEIFEWCCSGLTEKQVAQQLGITSDTVKNTLTHLYIKLGVENMTEALIVALRRGYLTIEDIPELIHLYPKLKSEKK